MLISNFITDLHIKATDRHQYLYYTSSHRHHTKKSIAYSQALRDMETFNWKCLIGTEIEKVKFPCTWRKKRHKIKGILLVITHHLYLKILPMWLESIFIFSIWIKKLKKSLLLVPWFHSEGQENWEAILLGLNCTP